MVKLRDIILQDPVAIDKWPRIVNSLIEATAADDIARIKRLLNKDGDYAEAVLQTLTIWYGYGNEAADLLQVLRQHGLNALERKIAYK